MLSTSLYEIHFIPRDSVHLMWSTSPPHDPIHLAWSISPHIIHSISYDPLHPMVQYTCSLIEAKYLSSHTVLGARLGVGFSISSSGSVHFTTLDRCSYLQAAPPSLGSRFSFLSLAQWYCALSLFQLPLSSDWFSKTEVNNHFRVLCSFESTRARNDRYVTSQRQPKPHSISENNTYRSF